MDILLPIIISAFTGAFVRVLVPGKDTMSFIMAMLLSIGGALIGILLGLELGVYIDKSAVFFLVIVLVALIPPVQYQFENKSSARS